MGKTETSMYGEDPLRHDRVHVRNFQALRDKRAFERHRLPFLKTVLDFDIVCEVAFHHFAGSPLTVKRLLLQNLAPTITVLRRLNRLCGLGIVARSRSLTDGRVHELRLHTDLEPVFAEYSRFYGPAAGSRDEPRKEVISIVEARTSISGR